MERSDGMQIPDPDGSEVVRFVTGHGFQVFDGQEQAPEE
jgi:hypothetical protein